MLVEGGQAAEDGGDEDCQEHGGAQSQQQGFQTDQHFSFGSGLEEGRRLTQNQTLWALVGGAKKKEQTCYLRLLRPARNGGAR